MTQTEAKAIQCPSCGGPLIFDPTIGKLRCSYCGSLFTPEEVDRHGGPHISAEEPTPPPGWGAEAEAIATYQCASCGAELITDRATTATLHCPYCGNNTVVPAQFSGSVRPNWVIPFHSTREQVLAAYHDYYQKKFWKRYLLPRSFRKKNRVEEVQGVYVPFWLFDGSAEVDAVYETYDAEKHGNHEIRHLYREERQGSVAFRNVPVDASKRMQNDLMDSIEPYDQKELMPFSLAYLPGFLAERFDVDASSVRRRAEDRVTKTAREKFRETITHEKLGITKKEELSLNFEGTNYALLPVWLLTSRWKDRPWTFAMNGQTGAITGDLPMSKLKTLLLVIPLMIVAFLIGNWIGDAGVGAIAALIVGAFVLLNAFSAMKPVNRATEAKQYMTGNVRLTKKQEEFLRDIRVQKGQEIKTINKFR